MQRKMSYHLSLVLIDWHFMERISFKRLCVTSLIKDQQHLQLDQATRIHETCGAEVLIMMTKGHVEDVFTPYIWATPRAKEFWAVGAAQSMASHAQEIHTLLKQWEKGSWGGMHLLLNPLQFPCQLLLQK